MTYATDKYLVFTAGFQVIATQSACGWHLVKSGQPQTNFFKYLPTWGRSRGPTCVQVYHIVYLRSSGLPGNRYKAQNLGLRENSKRNVDINTYIRNICSYEICMYYNNHQSRAKQATATYHNLLHYHGQLQTICDQELQMQVIKSIIMQMP